MQAPAHVQVLAGLSHGHPAELTVACLAIHTCGNVWAVVKVNKIRQDENWHPLDRFVISHCIGQFLLIGILDRNLLVTTPTLGFGR